MTRGNGPMAGPARLDVTAAAVSDPVFQVAHMSLAHPAPRGQPAVPILTDVSFEVGRGAHADGSVWLGKIDPPPLPESPRGGDRGSRPFRRPRHHVARPTRAPAARGAGPPDARPLMTVGLVQKRSNRFWHPLIRHDLTAACHRVHAAPPRPPPPAARGAGRGAG